MNTRPDPARGLRPALPLACRRWLRASVVGEQRNNTDLAHVQCPRCAPVAAFRSRFAALLAAAPKAPPALASRAMLDGILERIVDGSVGVVAGELSRPAAVPAAAWPEGLLTSAVAETMVRSASPTPAGGAWTTLQHRILADIGAGNTARLRRMRWLGLVAAAGIVCGAVLLTSGTEEPPTITFTDLETVPGVEFSIVRYGALR